MHIPHEQKEAACFARRLSGTEQRQTHVTEIFALPMGLGRAVVNRALVQQGRSH